MENPDVEEALKNCLSEEEHRKAKIFYCPGGIYYEKMTVASKCMMKLFVSALKAKKDKTEKEQMMADMISKSYDISDRKYIEPIVAWAKGE